MAAFIYHHYRLLTNTLKCSKIGALYIETMKLSIEQIIAKFPHKPFPVIKGEPNYQSIHNMWNLLYGNTSTLTNALGAGDHGHTRLVM